MALVQKLTVSEFIAGVQIQVCGEDRSLTLTYRAIGRNPLSIYYVNCADNRRQSVTNRGATRSDNLVECDVVPSKPMKVMICV